MILMQDVREGEFLFSRLPAAHEPLRRRETVVSRETTPVHRRADLTGMGDEEIHRFERTIVRVRRAVAVAVVRLTRGTATCEIDRHFEFADEDGYLSCLRHMRESCVDLLFGFEPYWPSSEYHVDVDVRIDDVPFDLKVSDTTGEPLVRMVPGDWRVRCPEGNLHPVFRRRVFSGTVWTTRSWHGRVGTVVDRKLLLADLADGELAVAAERIDGFEASLVGIPYRISAV